MNNDNFFECDLCGGEFLLEELNTDGICEQCEDENASEEANDGVTH